MASSPSHLFKATPNLSIDDQANIARALISANELYRVWNSNDYKIEERQDALSESYSLTQHVLTNIPNHSGALNLMARIEMDRCHYDEAESLIEKALKASPDDENIALNAGYLLLAQRRYSDAETHFLKILEKHRSSHRAFSGVALSKLRGGDFLGAMSHYKRLIELGFDNQQTRSLLMDAMEFLACETYQPDIEQLILKAFSWTDVDHSKLANLSASQIVAKFDLKNDQAILDLDLLLSDALLIDSIKHCLLPSVEVESLIVELRRAILTEVTMTDALRDELLPAAIAIGVYSARNDYILMMSAEEEREVTALAHRIHASTKATWTKDEVAGALIVLSMYEPLYSQNFSYRLLRYDLQDWPIGLQDLLASNLYSLSEEHQIEYELFGIDASGVTNNDIRRANERWSNLQCMNRTSFYHALVSALGSEVVPQRFKNDTVNILLLGCGSGQRALYLAQYFENVYVYGVDNRRENIAYATLKARQSGLTNIQFIHAEYDHALITEHQFDVIEFGDVANHVPDVLETIGEWQMLLQQDGLMRFDFATHQSNKTSAVINQLVKDRRLSPTADNIRHLRHAIIQESRSGLWTNLFNDPQFYTGSGCRELFFNKHNNGYDLKELDELLNTANLSFIGFADLDRQNRKMDNTLAPYSLLAWHVMDQDQALFKDSYPIYCAIAR